MQDTAIIPFIESQISDSGNRSICLIVKDMEQAEATKDHLAFFLPEENSVIVPSHELLPYDNQLLSSSALSEQVSALHQVMNAKGIYILCSQSLFEVSQSPETLQKNSLSISKGDKFDGVLIREKIKSLGYKEAITTREHGYFTDKGEIFDVYPIGQPNPVRIHIKDGTINNIMVFNSDSQKNENRIEDVILYANYPVPFSEDNRNRFCSAYWKAFGKSDSNYTDVKQGILIKECLSYVSLFLDKKHSILEYFSHDTLFFALTDIEKDLENFTNLCNFRYKEVSVAHNALEPNDAFMIGQIDDLINEYDIQKVDDVVAQPEVPISHENIRADKASATLRNVLKWNNVAERIVICVNSEGREKQLRMLFSMRNRELNEAKTWRDIVIADAGIYFIYSNIQQGLFYTSLKTVIFSEKEFFGSQSFTDVDYSNASSELSDDIEETPRGFPMTHVSKGVGRFMGLVKPDMDGVGDREYVLLEYANNSTIYVPIDKLDQLAEYRGIDPEDIPLDEGTGQKWIRKLGALESDVSDVAQNLILTKLSHKVSEREPYIKNNFEYNKFASGFSFMLTQDQHAAINDILQDLSSSTPMDRLLVGDVGYGKTEIAMRACFIAANNKRQCCVIAPTTLLAAQHYETFKARFKGTNISVGLMTRKNKSEEKETLQLLKKGELDIVIGTHRLLQNDVQLNNLGLLVIDEEHRFGVKQKQKIAETKANVDVLSLTATPIPRTLSSALHGVRSVSTIRTAPSKRLSIRTEMAELNDDLIRASIQREMLRGGQTFFLHNEISSIYEMAERVAQLVPDARVEFAHGKMNELELFEMMNRFRDHEFDVLVSTTIIETGIDIPNANTILINQCEKLGLAQMHQIRGRVGRGRRQAYAYLLTENLDGISEVAKKRMKAMCENTNLGGGFRLSSIDMEIRGAGEILGEKQSGHIHSLGYDLYFRLLDTAIQQLENDPEFVLSLLCEFDKEKVDKVINSDEEKTVEVETNLNMDSSIPESYIGDEAVRMYVYRKIIRAKNIHDIASLQEEIIDRYGPMPSEAEDVFAYFEAKRSLPAKGIKSITRKQYVFTITSYKKMTDEHESSLSEYLGHDAIVALISEKEMQISQSRDALKDITLQDIDKGLFGQ